LRFSSVFNPQIYQKDGKSYLGDRTTYLFHAISRKKDTSFHLIHAKYRKEDRTTILLDSLSCLFDGLGRGFDGIGFPLETNFVFPNLFIILNLS